MFLIGDINQPRCLRWPLTRTKCPRRSQSSPQKRATNVFFGVQRFCDKAINQRRRRLWPPTDAGDSSAFKGLHVADCDRAVTLARV